MVPGDLPQRSPWNDLLQDQGPWCRQSFEASLHCKRGYGTSRGAMEQSDTDAAWYILLREGVNLQSGGAYTCMNPLFALQVEQGEGRTSA